MSGYYILVRYVENPARCEPINFGVILQSEKLIDYRFIQRQDRKMPYDVYKKWVDYFTDELEGVKQNNNVSAMRMFNLSLNFEATHVSLTKPLLIETTNDFDKCLENLFEELVKPQG